MQLTQRWSQLFPRSSPCRAHPAAPGRLSLLQANMPLHPRAMQLTHSSNRYLSSFTLPQNPPRPPTQPPRTSVTPAQSLRSNPHCSPLNSRAGVPMQQ